MRTARENTTPWTPAPNARRTVHPLLHAVCTSFTEARIRWGLLSDGGATRGPVEHLDMLIDAAHAERAGVLLRELGFLRAPSTDRASHAPFFMYDVPTDCWIELDIVTGLGTSRAFRTQMGRLFRRRGISIALLGPDGAGKSTLASGIGRASRFPVRYVYMGLWPRNVDDRTWLDGVRGVAWFVRLLRAWRRYVVARLYLASGHLVIFDRYTFDALLPDGTKQRRLRKIAYWMLAHCCPPPDLVFVLDAPGRVMYDRKGEHHPDYLETQRQYFQLLSERLPNAHLIDATRGADAVRREVMAHIWRHVAARANRTPSRRDPAGTRLADASDAG